MPCALRIGVNALFLIPGGVGGTEIYLRNLLEALADVDPLDHYFVFINRETAEAAEPLTPRATNFETVVCPLRAASRPARLLWEQLALPWQAAARRVDVLFSPGFTSPLLCGRRNVTVIHDLQHKRQPQNFGAMELAAWRLSVWLSVRFSRHIVTVSEQSRRDIVEVYGVDPGRVQVIRHGLEAELFEPPPDRSILIGAGLGDWPYLLSISTIHPHKNWDRWLDAYGHLVSEGFAHHLVITGLQGKYSEELDRRIRASPFHERVHPTGWLPRRLLRAVLQHADALVFPSTFEGFGMPVLEAMAAGVPVACSDIAPLREVADGAALLFDPASSESMRSAVRCLLADGGLRHQLVDKGRRQAARFSWKQTATETLAVLRGGV